MKTLQFTIMLFAGLFLTGSAQAQGGDTTGLQALTQKVQQAYARAAYLGFGIKYRYSNAGSPDQYLDSLMGKVQMDKGRSRMVIDGMETLVTDKYAIQVMEDDKLIYLASPRRGMTQNPVSMLDSIFTHMQGVACRLEHRDGLDLLTLTFPAASPYSKLEIAIDGGTGYFRRVVYLLKTEGLVSNDMIASPGHPGPYQPRGRIEISFLDYEHGHFDDRLFSEDNFFTKTAGRYQPAGRYKDYHIYLASSNL